MNHARVSPPTARRILVVDDHVDSAGLAAELLRLRGHETRVAYDPETARQIAVEFEPEIVLLDIGLPGMSGYQLADLLRADPKVKHCRFIALTAHAYLRDEQASEAAGFEAHLTKPIGLQLLFDAVEARQIDPPGRQGPRALNTLWLNSEHVARDIIVIGGSAGAYPVIAELLAHLPNGLPAVIGIVIHRGAQSAADWSVSLGRKATLRVVEAVAGVSLERGTAYIAPSDQHMTFSHERAELNAGAKEHSTRPAVDPLFVSASQEYGPRVVGVVISGAGRDGLQGLLHVTAAGGLSLVQAPSEAQQPSMPQYSIAHDHVSAALTVDRIAEVLVRLANGEAVSLGAAEASFAATTRGDTPGGRSVDA